MPSFDLHDLHHHEIALGIQVDSPDQPGGRDSGIAQNL